MDVRPIKSEADYQWAIAEIARYFDKQPTVGSPEGDRFDVLSDLVSAYEERHEPLPEADPIAVLCAAMDEAGLGQSDLAELLGSRSRASEILNRRRLLTVEMIHRLQKDWRVPASLMVRPYVLALNSRAA